jgi:hypothetical protein
LVWRELRSRIASPLNVEFRKRAKSLLLEAKEVAGHYCTVSYRFFVVAVTMMKIYYTFLLACSIPKQQVGAYGVLSMVWASWLCKGFFCILFAKGGGRAHFVAARDFSTVEITTTRRRSAVRSSHFGRTVSTVRPSSDRRPSNSQISFAVY